MLLIAGFFLHRPRTIRAPSPASNSSESSRAVACRVAAVLAAVIPLVFLCGCQATPRAERSLDSTVQCKNPESVLGCFRIIPIGLVGPVVRSHGGWIGHLPSQTEAAQSTVGDRSPSYTPWQVQLLVAIVGPPSGGVGLARKVRLESNFRRLVDVVDAASNQLLTFGDGGGTYWGQFAGVAVDVDAPHCEWDSKRLMDGLALSVAVIRVDFVTAPQMNRPYLVSLAPLQQALDARWEKLPVVVDVRPVELMLREP